jgi:hypothetical protein
VRLLLPDQAEQIPRSIWQHDAMDLGRILYREQQIVECFVD